MADFRRFYDIPSHVSFDLSFFLPSSTKHDSSASTEERFEVSLRFSQQLKVVIVYKQAHCYVLGVVNYYVPNLYRRLGFMR